MVLIVRLAHCGHASDRFGRLQDLDRPVVLLHDLILRDAGVQELVILVLLLILPLLVFLRGRDQFFDVKLCSLFVLSIGSLLLGVLRAFTTCRQERIDDRAELLLLVFTVHRSDAFDSRVHLLEFSLLFVG